MTNLEIYNLLMKRFLFFEFDWAKFNSTLCFKTDSRFREDYIQVLLMNLNSQFIDNYLKSLRSRYFFAPTVNVSCISMLLEPLMKANNWSLKE